MCLCLYIPLPPGATTNSDSGVTDMQAIQPALAALAEAGMPLLVHSEVTEQEVDVFEREAAFVERILKVGGGQVGFVLLLAFVIANVQDWATLPPPCTPQNQPLVQGNPSLKVVMEHITTADGVEFVLSCGENVGATITPQHLMYNRNGEQ